MKESKIEFDVFRLENQLASKLKDARIGRRISQAELADMSGLTQQTISNLENGVWSPKLITLSKIATALELKLKVELVG